MISGKPKGKRGRPKKVVTDIPKVTDGIKKKRGRPSKLGDVKGIENIEVVDKVKSVSDEVEESYIPPKIERRNRVFRFDKKVFHAFAKKYGYDISKMSYVFDMLMRLYSNKTVDIPKLDEKYYRRWWQGSPPIEPIYEKELVSSHALMRGVPVQYKYSLLIDPEIFAVFEKSCKLYSPYVSNELVKMVIDDKVTIDMSKCDTWCVL